MGILLGTMSLLLSPSMVLAALFAAGGAVLALKRPELLLLAVLFFSSTIVDEATIPVFNLIFFKLYITDIFLVAGFGIIAVRLLGEPKEFKLVSTPIDPLVMGFFVIAIVTAFLGQRAGVEREHMISELRIVIYYVATFFIVTNLVRTRAQLWTLIYGFVGLAVFVASAMVLQFIVGDSTQILPGRVEHLVTTGEEYGDITRIVSVGEGLVLAAFIAMMTNVFFREYTVRANVGFLVSCLLGMAVLITFNRNFWVAVLIAVVILAIIFRGKQRVHMLSWILSGVLMLIIALLFTFSLPGGGRAQTLVFATMGRMFSLVDEENYEADESTYRWRSFEYLYAVPTVVENPLTGIGLGAIYRPTLDEVDGYNFNGQRYIHNAHFWIMMKTGIPGYVFFIGMGLAMVGRAMWYWSRITAPLLKGVALGFALTYVGVAVGSIVNPMFMQWYWTPVIGIMMGTNEVILRNFVQDENEDG